LRYGLKSVMVNLDFTPLLRWMIPDDCGPSSPSPTSTRLMCLAQLGHWATRPRCCHALSSGRYTVNSRRSSVIIPCHILYVMRVSKSPRAARHEARVDASDELVTDGVAHMAPPCICCRTLALLRGDGAILSIGRLGVAVAFVKKVGINSLKMIRGCHGDAYIVINHEFSEGRTIDQHNARRVVRYR